MLRAKSAPSLARAAGAKSPRLSGGAEEDEDASKRQSIAGTPVPPYLHPTKCGIPGKLYSPHDYVTPICDSMSAMNDRAYGSGMGRLVQREERRRLRTIMDSANSAPDSCAFADSSFGFEDMGINQYSSNIVKPDPLKPNELCFNCRTTNVGSQRVDDRTGRFVCEECGAEGDVYTYGTDYKETNDTDDSKARADHPTTVRQDPRFVNQPKTGTVISTSAKRKNNLGFAQEQINKQAERQV